MNEQPYSCRGNISCLVCKNFTCRYNISPENPTHIATTQQQVVQDAQINQYKELLDIRMTGVHGKIDAMINDISTLNQNIITLYGVISLIKEIVEVLPTEINYIAHPQDAELSHNVVEEDINDENNNEEIMSENYSVVRYEHPVPNGEWIEKKGVFGKKKLVFKKHKPL